MIWKNAKTEDPSFAKVNHLVIVKVNNSYVYAFAYYDGENWVYNTVKNAEVIAFTETDPKEMLSNFI